MVVVHVRVMLQVIETQIVKFEMLKWSSELPVFSGVDSNVCLRPSEKVLGHAVVGVELNVEFNVDRFFGPTFGMTQFGELTTK
jgi:hypothetical protein